MTSHDDISPDYMHWLSRKLLWVEKPGAGKRVLIVLLAICAVLALADFAYHKHAYFHIEEIPFIYAVYGFVSYATVIFLAKGLRLIIRRPEDYYAQDSTEVEDERPAGSDPSTLIPGSLSDRANRRGGISGGGSAHE